MSYVKPLDMLDTPIHLGDVVQFTARHNGSCGYSSSNRFLAFGRVADISESGKTITVTMIWVPKGFRSGYKSNYKQSTIPGNALVIDNNLINNLIKLKLD